MAYKKVAQSTALPPLPKVRIRRPAVANANANNSCLVMMSSLLNCWAANGEGSPTCLSIEKDLKVCMETKLLGKAKSGSVNYHAGRLYPRLRRNVND